MSQRVATTGSVMMSSSPKQYDRGTAVWVVDPFFNKKTAQANEPLEGWRVTPLPHSERLEHPSISLQSVHRGSHDLTTPPGRLDATR